jgi:trans-2,3-dihydro-3-hydroxyanthranilate isomerase
MELRATWLDVFAEAPMQGNFHLVVHDADALSDEVMTLFSARTRLAETSFIQRPRVDGATYRHRIYVPGKEVPFAGHPSLGVAAAHGWATGQSSGTFVQQTLSGLQRLEFQLDARRGEVALTQNPAVFGEVVDPAIGLRIAGLDPHCRHPELVPQWVSTGMPTLVIPVRQASDLSRVVFDWAAFRAELAAWPDFRAFNGYICAEQAPGRWAARCYGEDPATNEDPATGSAAGPLGAYLKRHTGTTSMQIDQGVEMGSPSRLRVDTSADIVVSGTVWHAGEGVLRLPASLTAPRPVTRSTT